MTRLYPDSQVRQLLYLVFVGAAVCWHCCSGASSKEGNFPVLSTNNNHQQQLLTSLSQMIVQGYQYWETYNGEYKSTAFRQKWTRSKGLNSLKV